jgi:hypothetical protein
VRVFEYITIMEVGRSESGKTGIHLVQNNNSGDTLGVVSWHGPWHQYVFAPSHATIFSAGCLKDIDQFLEETSVEQRKSRRVPEKPGA